MAGAVAAPPDGTRVPGAPLVARWVVRTYLVAPATALVSIAIVTRRPSVELATNWAAAWVGFDG